MTDEEFENQVQHTSLMGTAMTELQRVLDPSHKAEFVIEAQEEEFLASTDSGDFPESGSPRES